MELVSNSILVRPNPPDPLQTKDLNFEQCAEHNYIHFYINKLSYFPQNLI